MQFNKTFISLFSYTYYIFMIYLTHKLLFIIFKLDYYFENSHRLAIILKIVSILKYGIYSNPRYKLLMVHYNIIS